MDLSTRLESIYIRRTDDQQAQGGNGEAANVNSASFAAAHSSNSGSRNAAAPQDTESMIGSAFSALRPTQSPGAARTQTGPNDRVAAYRNNMPESGITLFTHRSAPNGFKVAVVLSELQIKYHVFYVDLEHHEERSPSYVELNPNARLPSIIDHDNDNFSLWESGAILEYICRRPQTLEQQPELVNQLLGGPDFRQQAQVSAWMYFQASGHAPIIGHSLQFRFVEANAPSTAMAIVADRFMAEAKRVAAVIEVFLAEKREQLAEDMEDEEDDYLQRPVWLVGDEITLADLAFIPWNQVMTKLGINLKNDYPEVYKWTEKTMARPRVVAGLGMKSQ